MDEVLLFLLQSGASKAPFRLTTVQLGKALGMTQQNASWRLQKLEDGGFIRRSYKGIVVTAKGILSARKVYAGLKEVFEGPFFELRGILKSGLGEGRYYLSIEQYQNAVKNILGFVPYAGTLNIEIDEHDLWKREALLSKAIFLPAFEAAGRKYGALSIYPCFIKGKFCAVIFPERTHHGDNTIEVISDVNLRKYLRKKDGDEVVLRPGVFG